MGERRGEATVVERRREATVGERRGEATVRKRQGEGKAGASWVGDHVESGNRVLIYTL